jgi:hypothetical protein
MGDHALPSAASGTPVPIMGMMRTTLMIVDASSPVG